MVLEKQKKNSQKVSMHGFSDRNFTFWEFYFLYERIRLVEGVEGVPWYKKRCVHYDNYIVYF
jgi:hypothetical protein